MKKIAILALFINAISCNQKNSKETTSKDINHNKEVINTTLKKMYNGDLHNQYPLEDTLIFSKEVVKLNSQCDSVSKVDADRIANSNNPTDKPILREGSRVSSLYEGVSDFKIDEIKTLNNTTEVLVTLSNKNYSDIKPWKEKIVFIDQKGFKIDNIYFDINNPKNSNLKKSLLDFTKQSLTVN